MKKIIILFISLTAISLAQTAGKSGLSFLKFGFGARNIAMGDAGNAAANDVTALFYNPANLPQSNETQLIFMHNQWIEDIRSEVGGVKFNLFGLTMAAGFNVSTIADIEVRTRPGDADSKFNAHYFFGSLSAKFNVIENLSAGATIKYLYEGIFADQSTGIGYDIGLSYKTTIEGLLISGVIKNLGSMNQLRNEETKLPAELRIGPSYQFALSENKFIITTAAEFQKYLETDDTHFSLGAEILYDNLIAIRGGYQSGYESKSVSGGIGLRWGNLGFDYAISPFSLGLGTGHSVSVGFRF